MRSILSMFLALIFILCNGNILGSNGDSSSPDIYRMSPSELATAEKEASQIKVAMLQTTPTHLPFDESHFSYSSEEWKPFKISNDTQFDPLDTMMMKVSLSDPAKQVKLSLDLPDNSSVVVRYFVFLTSNEKSPPEFKVMLSSRDGMDKCLKIENTEGMWINSSVVLHSEINDKIVFAAKRREKTNEIGLRFVTIQKPSEDVEDPKVTGCENRKETESFEQTKANNSLLLQLEELDNSSTKVINNSVSLLNETNYTLKDTKSGVDKISDVENVTMQSSVLDVENATSTDVQPSSTVTNPPFKSSNDEENQSRTLPDDASNDKLNISTTASNVSILPTELSPSNISSLTNITVSTSSTPIGPIKELFGAKFGKNQTVANETLGERSKGRLNDDSESSSGIFYFFLVIMLASAVIFLFIYILRKRRRRDDELPVFRTGNNLGDSTYLDEDTEMDIRFSSGNYRSFK